MLQKARNLRKNQTDAEKLLWRHLRNRQLAGCKFRRQYPVGRYIVDLVCLSQQLVVELDGSQHAESTCRDEIRTRFLHKQGFKVVRFWNNAVFSDTEAVLQKIYNEVKREAAPHPSLLPEGEGTV